MLKIKDDVELKELKKYGIKEAPDVKGLYGYCNKYNGVWMYLFEFDSQDRIIKIVNPYYDCFDKLYDLIQAGLLEKVEDMQ